MNVRDDDVGDVCGFEADLGNSFGGFDEIFGFPSLDKFVAVKARVYLNVAPARPFEQPDYFDQYSF